VKRLYLIRHGSVHNPGSIVYRRLPGFLLSELGRIEAAQMADFLAEQPVEIIWHSPLERARETAAFILESGGAPLVEDERIHEWAEGERSEEVLERMWSFLESWRASPYEAGAAVSHRDPIRRLLFAVQDEPADMDDLTRFPLPPAGVYRLSEEDGRLTAESIFVPPIYRQE
jgi:broad specificity phosphatase PhoE